MISPIVLVPLLVGFLVIFTRYLKSVKFVYSLPNVGFPLPFLGEHG